MLVADLLRSVGLLTPPPRLAPGPKAGPGPAAAAAAACCAASSAGGKVRAGIGDRRISLDGRLRCGCS